MSDELTLGEVHRLSLKNEGKIESLDTQLGVERQDRAQERHAFRNEMSGLFSSIQSQQLDLLDRSSRMEERLSTLNGMQAIMLSQATTIGEQKESLRGMERNHSAILDLTAKVASVTTRLDIVQQMGGKSISLVTTVAMTAAGSLIVGLLVYALTHSK
jgi:hypothetical protein